MRAFALALIVGSLAAAANAANWQQIAKSGTGTVVSIDTQSVVRQGDTALGWFQFEGGEQTREGVAYARERQMADCRAQLIGKISYVDYAPDGSVLRSRSTPATIARQMLEPVVPDTTGEAIFHRLCG